MLCDIDILVVLKMLADLGMISIWLWLGWVGFRDCFF